MLCLSRKVDESVILLLPNGIKVEVMLIRILGDKVRIAFDAPDEVQIIRKELLVGKEKDSKRPKMQ